MSAELKILKVAGGEHGVLLQDFLCTRLGVTRNRAKRLLDDRAVFVNQQRVWMARHPLAADDRVEVRVRRAGPVAGRERLLQVLHDDADYVIIDKPAGLLSNGERSVETRLKAQLQCPDLQAVHRLDRDTSGCFLLARSARAMSAMVDVFQRREVEKTYLALATGRVPGHLRTIRTPVDSQEAITHLRVLRVVPRATLLELHPETGRTHQIRRHLAAAHHPLIGDKQYQTRAIEDDAAREAPRQMLHAAKLSFKHPATGQVVKAEAPAPADFLATQHRLGLG